MIAFKTTRFGRIEVSHDQVIHFPEGLVGFSHLKRFILIDHKDSEVKWLQAVDDPDVAFIVIDPFLLNPSYEFKMPEAAKGLIGLEDVDDLAVLVIVRIYDDKLLANFHGPLVLNSATKRGVQLVVERPAGYVYNNTIEPLSLQK